jgi:hypothetical protein
VFKFTLLFIIFNFIFLFTLASGFIIPSALLSISPNWWVLGAMLVFIIVIDTLFISNRKFLKILEKQDWDELIEYLEHEVYIKNKVSYLKIRLLCSLFILQSKMSSIDKLENYVRVHKPSVFSKTLSFFVTFSVLRQNIPYGIELLESSKFIAKGREGIWQEWYKGFCFYLKKDFETASKFLGAVLPKLKSMPLLQGITLYILDGQLKQVVQEEVTPFLSEIEKSKTYFLRKYRKTEWLDKIKKEENEIPGILLNTFEDAVCNFLFK